ncbi:Uncharacterized protein dnm_093970 [Desulfonema magnum]|uniref:Uncharacterized protein n=1 Tax=Desulfonema magnum TaxID=45655 RepID=A0A975GTP8_9BACT|nr:Uncharacterized protein dnm_093970 [Desulfonema magnum]
MTKKNLIIELQKNFCDFLYQDQKMPAKISCGFDDFSCQYERIWSAVTACDRYSWVM